jgi:hypothetical protein
MKSSFGGRGFHGQAASERTEAIATLPRDAARMLAVEILHPGALATAASGVA